jgi:hypothetical protein
MTLPFGRLASSLKIGIEGMVCPPQLSRASFSSVYLAQPLNLYGLLVHVSLKYRLRTGIVFRSCLFNLHALQDAKRHSIPRVCEDM